MVLSLAYQPAQLGILEIAQCTVERMFPKLQEQTRRRKKDFFFLYLKKKCFGAVFSHTIIHHGVISGGLMWEWDITTLPAVHLQKIVHTLQNLCYNEQKLSHRQLKPFARGYEARKEQQLKEKLFHLPFPAL